MFKFAYASAVVLLLGATAYASAGIEDRQGQLSHGAGLVLLTSLQRI